MKAYIAVYADSGLVHTVCGTASLVADVAEGSALLHGHEAIVYLDAGYQGVHERPDTKLGMRWNVAMRPGKPKKLAKANNPIDALVDRVEKLKASVRVKVEHPFCLNQAPVWLREHALPGTEEKHAVIQNAVCAV